jgi:hypothetical protein
MCCAMQMFLLSNVDVGTLDECMALLALMAQLQHLKLEFGAHHASMSNGLQCMLRIPVMLANLTQIKV